MRHAAFVRIIVTGLFTFHFSLFTSSAQTRITHTWRQTPLSDVLRTIGEESKDYHIHYIHEQLDSIQVNAKVQQMTVPDAVGKVTRGQPVKVKQKEQDIFIQYKKHAARKRLKLSGRIKDSRSHADLPDATVQLLTADSMLIQQKKAGGTYMIFDRSYSSGEFSFEIPKAPANYIIRVSHVGYQTAYLNVSLSRLGRWEFQRDLPPIYMKEERHLLKGVEVVASKVMFYYRGDTLVYNADAFQLAEGSMLDALVKQLPGVELREGGRIYHNGKFVQNLLLNGKDFFRGNQSLLLENLPSYTVKEVKVYDKYGRESELLGTRLPDDKEYVMDVQLKREYSIGWLANAEGGLGTSDRYLARLFAMRHTDHSRVAIISNLNNLNDEDKPGETKTWLQKDQALSGRKSHGMVGIDYKLEERDKKWILNGDAQFSHTDQDELVQTERTNYLTSGDTRENYRRTNRNKAVKADFFNQLKVKGFSLWQETEYQKTDLQSAYQAITLSPTDSLLNEQIRQGMTKSRSFNTLTDLRYILKHKLGASSLSATVQHSDQNDDRFERFHIGYSTPGTADTGNQYTQGHPDKTTKAILSLWHRSMFNTSSHLGCEYSFRYEQQHKQSALYLLDLIDSLQSLPFGTLPSTLDYKQAMDIGNTYNSRRRDTEHRLRPMLHHSTKMKKGQLDITLMMTANYISRHLNYQRGSTDTTIVDKTLYLSQAAGSLEWKSNDQQRSASLGYYLNETPPELVYFVNIRDTTDPLNLQEAGGELKNTCTHKAEAKYQYNNKEKQSAYQAQLSYKYTQQDLAMGYRYQPTTGIRIWKPYNVDGNWSIQLRGQADLPLDRQKRLNFNGVTSWGYWQSVDMIDERRSQVNTADYRQTLGLNWKVREHTLGLRLEGGLRKTTSPRADFDDFSYLHLENSVTAHLKLPWKMELSTEFNVLAKSGYAYDDLNKTELVWNARLSRPFMKGRLLVIIDGYDLLCQRSSISRTVNAQGRTETHTNTLPNYALLHAIWRLNKQPKKKN